MPANDPLMIAHLITKLSDDEELLEKVSKASIAQASARHDKQIIKEQIYSIYSKIIKFHTSNI